MDVQCPSGHGLCAGCEVLRTWERPPRDHVSTTKKTYDRPWRPWVESGGSACSCRGVGSVVRVPDGVLRVSGCPVGPGERALRVIGKRDQERTVYGHPGCGAAPEPVALLARQQHRAHIPTHRQTRQHHQPGDDAQSDRRHRRPGPPAGLAPPAGHPRLPPNCRRRPPRPRRRPRNRAKASGTPKRRRPWQAPVTPCQGSDLRSGFCRRRW